MTVTAPPVPSIPRPTPTIRSRLAAAAAWCGNTAQYLVYGLAFGHIGKFAMVAVYFILTQWLHGQYIGSWHAWNIKYVWDHLFSANVAQGGLHAWLTQGQWNTFRHTIRPFYEGLYGALLFQQIGADPTRLKKYARPWQILATPFVVGLVGSIVGVLVALIGLPLVHLVTHGNFAEVALQKHPALWQKIYADSYDAVIIGLIAGFAVHRVARKALRTNMANFCRLWRRVGFGPSLMMPQGMRHEVARLREEPHALDSQAGGYLTAAIVFMALLTATLAGYGYYILTHIAH